MQAFREVNDAELDVAIEYAKKEYGIECLDRDLLRNFANKALRQYHETPRAPFPFIAATVIRAKLRARTKAEDDKVQAFKGAVCKIGTDRKHYKDMRKSSPPVAATSPSTQRFPVNKKTGQYRML